MKKVPIELVFLLSSWAPHKDETLLTNPGQ